MSSFEMRRDEKTRDKKSQCSVVEDCISHTHSGLHSHPKQPHDKAYVHKKVAQEHFAAQTGLE